MKTFLIIALFIVSFQSFGSQEIPSYRLAITPSRYVVDKIAIHITPFVCPQVK